MSQSRITSKDDARQRIQALIERAETFDFPGKSSEVKERRRAIALTVLRKGLELGAIAFGFSVREIDQATGIKFQLVNRHLDAMDAMRTPFFKRTKSKPNESKSSSFQLLVDSVAQGSIGVTGQPTRHLARHGDILTVSNKKNLSGSSNKNPSGSFPGSGEGVDGLKDTFINRDAPGARASSNIWITSDKPACAPRYVYEESRRPFLDLLGSDWEIIVEWLDLAARPDDIYDWLRKHYLEAIGSL